MFIPMGVLVFWFVLWCIHSSNSPSAPKPLPKEKLPPWTAEDEAEFQKNFISTQDENGEWRITRREVV